MELNHSQKQFVTNNEIKDCILNGPPGTGKTNVIKEFIQYNIEKDILDKNSVLLFAFNTSSVTDIKKKCDFINKKFISTFDAQVKTIMKYNDNTAESKNDQSDTTSFNESKKQEVTSGTTLSAYSDANEQTCAILDSNMIKLPVDNRIVLRITSDIFLEEAKYHDVEDGISGLNQASYDEFDDFKPEHLELKPTTESFPRRINSFFSSSGDLEEYTLKALSSMDKSLSELELWSLDRRSQSSDLGLSMHSTGSRCASPSRKPSTPRCMTSDQANFAGRTELDYDSDRSSGEDSSDAKSIVGLTFDDVMNPSE